MNGESPLASANINNSANNITISPIGTIHHILSCQIRLPSEGLDCAMTVFSLAGVRRRFIRPVFG